MDASLRESVTPPRLRLGPSFHKLEPFSQSDDGRRIGSSKSNELPRVPTLLKSFDDKSRLSRQLSKSGRVAAR